MNQLLDSLPSIDDEPEKVHSYSYGAFGEGTETGFGFTGRWGGTADNSAGVLNWNRWYSSTLGAWLNRDPSELSGGPNFYGYVSNQTTISYDKTGKGAEVLIGGGLIGGLLLMELAREAALKKNATSCPTFKANNKCSGDTQKAIRNVKDNECKVAGCSFTDSRETIMAKLASATVCLAVRVLEQKQCFDRPDAGHLGEIVAQTAKFSQCELIAKFRGYQ